MSRVVVIGAGLAGLSAACRLVGDGWDVTVVEREPVPGGRSGLLQRDGWTFDTGPSVLTMRDLIADALSAAGTDIADVLPLRRLDPAYRARFADGSTIHVRHGRDAMREEIRATCGDADADAFDGFVDWLRRLYEVEMPHFIDRNFDSPLDLVADPRAAATLVRLGGFGRLGPAVRRRFRDPRLHRLFSFQALYAGLSPQSALAIYAVITYMDSIEGVWWPDGGLHAVPLALATAAEKAGAEVLLGTGVRTVLRRPDTGAVAGVELDSGERIAADAVVCTLDPETAYRSLLPDLSLPRRVRRARHSPSAVVWHVGARGLPAPGTAHHNIHFGEQWDESFEALLDRRELMPDPSRLVTVPTVTDPSMAPPGSTSMFVLEPVPHLGSAIDWRREAGPMRDRLLAFLAENGYPTDVAVEELVTPLEWQRMGMAGGTPFATAHTFGQTGPFRVRNTVRELPGLFLAGSGTVPGVGVPMVLVSGKLAAERVRGYLRDGAA
ncbi:phytoene desaturase family protein [Nakamurella endophytica]|uniref:Phytoene dehydrogenase n=1 Tax=Nakamurella endophytica TaxID=1748367 RepID=A0A917WKP7_9ACTN|nr:phytoene desaturase family protein [Nakamurella endophytica]GGM12132.1 phytoene dehydrogenase [Nakamurella endophytica]